MKKFFFLLLILAFIFYFFPKKNPLVKTVIPLPSLFVSGNKILRSDNKKPVQLKGVTTMTFTYKGLKVSDLINRLEKTKAWPVNLLGLYINPFEIKNRWAELDQVIKWTEKNKIYVYLIPAVNVHDRTHGLSDQILLLDDLLELLSVRYSAYHHLMYGFWAEPRGIPWVGWLSVVKTLAEKLRKTNPQAIILVTGTQFGRFVSDSEKLTFDNFIFDIHDYPWANRQQALSFNLKNPSGILWDQVYQKYPVLIGEFGGVYEKDFGSPEDLSYIRFVLNEVNKKDLHYTAYSVDQEGELGIMDWENNLPTKKGRLILEDLKNYPPTRF